MPEVDINWWAVLVGGVSSMVIGFVWYSMPVFGKSWMKEIGKSEKELKDGANGGMYFLMFLGSLVLAYIMSHFVDYAAADTAAKGLQTALWAWLGFAATTGLSHKIFDGTSWKLFLINYGYHLVQFGVIGIIVAAWK